MYTVGVGGNEFLVNENISDILALTVTPLSLDDGRCIRVLRSTDTETGDVLFTIMAPSTVNIDEIEIWGLAVQVASVIMAQGDGNGNSGLEQGLDENGGDVT